MNPFPFEAEHTAEDLARMRKESVELIMQVEAGSPDFTCDFCSRRFECVFVFDPYNTNGDCLAEK